MKNVFSSLSLTNHHAGFFCNTALLACFCPYEFLSLSHFMLVFQGTCEHFKEKNGFLNPLIFPPL